MTPPLVLRILRSEDLGRPGYQYDPTNPYLWFVIPYLDTDNDGKVSVGDLYDGRVVEVLQSIFDGLDVLVSLSTVHLSTIRK